MLIRCLAVASQHHMCDSTVFHIIIIICFAFNVISNIVMGLIHYQ